MALTDDDVREILRLIDESELDELRIETAEFKLHVVRREAAAPEREAAAPEREPAASESEAPAAKPATDGASATIAAPMPGTFYRADGPGMAPFVEVGTHVEPDTVVCIIEIMKMMNSVPAGVAGTIVEVCAEDAQLVGDGEALFRVES
jgi:acetyl-CoA carboxylase biotin carboxyl carrier protein